MQLPLKYRAKPPAHSVKLVLTIRADGSVSGARIEQSSGDGDLDEIVRDWVVASGVFSPARKAGKAVESEFPFEMVFGPLD